MRDLTLRYTLLFMAFLFSRTLFAGTVHMQMDHQDGELGEQFQLSVTISGDLSGKVELPTIPDLEIAGTGTSTNISWINGSLSKETAYNFVLVPQREGTYTIPSFKLKIDGDWVSTEAIRIMVHSGGGNAPAPSAPGSHQARNGAPSNRTDDSANQGKTDPNIFIEREFSKTSPYEGEPIIVTTKIFHRVEIAKVESNNEKPSGVRVLEIKQFNAQEERGNSLYNVIVIKQTMVPSRSGKISIPGFRIKAAMIMPSEQTQRRGNRSFDSFFDDFFNGARNRVVQRVIASKDSELNVKAIPSEGRPAHFRDLVGTFRIDSELSQSELKAGDTATLTITIDGVGALDSMGNLDLQLGPNIRAYPDKPQVQEKATERHGLESKRIFRYALVPTHKGEYKLGQLKIPYFDLDLKKYQELVTDLGTLKVAEGDEKNAAPPTGTSSASSAPLAARADVKALANDLIDIHRRISLECKQTLSSRDYAIALVMVGVPGLLSLLLLILQSFKNRTRSQSHLRRKTALKNFERRLNQAEGPTVLENCYAAYRAYIGDRFGLHGTALTSKEMSEELSKHKVPKSILSELESLEAAIQQSQYAGEAVSTDRVEELVQKMKRLAREIEKQC